MNEQELYSPDEKAYIVIVNPNRQFNSSKLNPGEIQMPDHTEKIIFESSTTTYKRKCNACPISHQTLHLLIIGDTKLIKLCPNCKRRLKKCVVK